MFTFLKRFFGSSNDRIIVQCHEKVKKINALSGEFEALSDDELCGKTAIFKERLARGESLEDILPEAFATVRETAKRILGERHYDVQLIGGMILNKGMIAEMKTGEGKTLVSTLPVYLNALTGKGVHVVTVNDYLALRDSEWMGRVHRFLGLSVGCILHDMKDSERRAAYASDITYATNNELGFDYLRDNMKFNLGEMVHRPFNYAVVDEIDSILIDEARTPLIISGPTEDSSEMYHVADKIVRQLDTTDYEKDEKHNNATLTELGMEKTEKLFREVGALKSDSLYDIQNVSCVHHINQALKAHALFQRDRDYIVKDGRVIIIDEFTGRMMDGRRYSDGLHQALEAKEGAPVQTENQTLASITFQNFFRLYPKLSGMTGTAFTEAQELMDIYHLEVVVLPTNLPCARKDQDDEVYRTEQEKIDAILKTVKECQARQQPVLIGTASIEKSEQFSEALKKHKVVHQVLNARYHEQEAHIIAEAGHPGGVTIATNMAGRGTDIKLGGTLESRLKMDEAELSDEKIKRIQAAVDHDHKLVKEVGGLYVIGTERHESRRIDNQLRGRSGRQGDPGASKFFLSLQDDLMRIFGSDRLDSMLRKLGLKEGEAIIHPWVNKAIERAQTKVEARNFDIRKHLLKYDDVMNDQRKIIYEQRREIMESQNVSEMIAAMRAQAIDGMITLYIPEKTYVDQWDVAGLNQACERIFGLTLPFQAWTAEEGITGLAIHERITQAVNQALEKKFQNTPPELLQLIEKSVLLRSLDQEWKDHLLSLDHLRQGINLRAYGQKDPLNEYKSEAFSLFQEMLSQLREQVISVLSQFNFGENLSPQDLAPEEQQMIESRQDPALSVFVEPEEEGQRVTRRPADKVVAHDPSTWGRVQRNAVCPCGSGKKYKMCHGKI